MPSIEMGDRFKTDKKGVAPMKASRTMTGKLTIRMTPEDLAAAHKIAKSNNKNTSDLVRTFLRSFK